MRSDMENVTNAEKQNIDSTLAQNWSSYLMTLSQKLARIARVYSSTVVWYMLMPQVNFLHLRVCVYWYFEAVWEANGIGMDALQEHERRQQQQQWQLRRNHFLLNATNILSQSGVSSSLVSENLRRRLIPNKNIQINKQMRWRRSNSDFFVLLLLLLLFMFLHAYMSKEIAVTPILNTRRKQCARVCVCVCGRMNE